MSQDRRAIIRTLGCTAAALALAPLAAPAVAQEAPLRILVGFPAGGSIDTIARNLAAEISPLLNRNVVVDNRPGAGGQIAAVALKTAAADGNTVFLTNSHTVSMIPLTVRHPGFDPAKDFVPVSRVAISPDVLGVNVKLVGDKGGLKEYMEWAKANPGKGTVGVPAPASAPDFAVKMMATSFGAQLTSVPYRGDGPVVQDLIAGQVSAGIGSVGAMSQHVKAGTIRLVAVNLPARMPAMPEVPTYSEQGLKGYESGNYVALFAPAGVSAEFVARLNQAVGQATRSAEFGQKLAALGITASHSTPGELATQVRDTDRALAEMVKAADFRMP
jgi:tripartite-type tricarboxylate transporter receptor subunit TctC